MTDGPKTFIKIEWIDGKFVAFLPIEDVGTVHNPEKLAAIAAQRYTQHIKSMRGVMAQIDARRAKRIPVAASLIWDLGDLIFRLRDSLASLGLEIDDLYEHLSRDLSVKRKWLEKVIIFRRYIPSRSMIPQDLNWGKCEKGTRRKAEQIAAGKFMG